MDYIESCYNNAMATQRMDYIKCADIKNSVLGRSLLEDVSIDTFSNTKNDSKPKGKFKEKLSTFRQTIKNSFKDFFNTIFKSKKEN